MKRIGIPVFGIGLIAAGMPDPIWGELEPNHHPLQARGDHIPGMTAIGYIVGANAYNLTEVGAAWVVAAWYAAPSISANRLHGAQ